MIIKLSTNSFFIIDMVKVAQSVLWPQSHGRTGADFNYMEGEGGVDKLEREVCEPL